MEPENGKTTVWIPREAFESVQRLWKPEFSWIPVPFDASLPPDCIAFIQTTGPVSPLPPLPLRPPRTPFSPFAHLTPLGGAARETPYTPAGLLAPGLRAEAADYFGGSAVLSETGVLAAGPAGPEARLERSCTPTMASEPGSPSTPKNTSHPMLPEPQIWRPSQELQASNGAAQVDERAQERVPEFLVEKPRAIKAPVQPDYVPDSWNIYDTAAEEYRPAPRCVKPARTKKRRSGKRNFKMEDHWQTAQRDEAQWTESKKGFAVRLEVNLEMEVEIRGFVHGDITLSAESLHYDTGEAPMFM